MSYIIMDVKHLTFKEKSKIIGFLKSEFKLKIKIYDLEAKK